MAETGPEKSTKNANKLCTTKAWAKSMKPGLDYTPEVSRVGAGGHRSRRVPGDLAANHIETYDAATMSAGWLWGF